MKSLWGKLGVILVCVWLLIFCKYAKTEETSLWWKPVNIGEKWGFENETGEIVIKPQFDDAKYFSYGLAAVKIRGKWGFIDEKGKNVIDSQFDFTTGFSFDGFAAVKVGDKWGYVDKMGKYVIEPRFDDVSWRFSEGLAAVKMGGKWGFINRTGNIVINPMFDNPYESISRSLTPWFVNGKASVKLFGELVYIDMRGEVMSPDWEFWCKMEGEEGPVYAFYNKKIMIYPSKDTVRVWVREYKQDKEFKMTLSEIDCLNKRYHFIQIINFDKEGKVRSSHSYDPEESEWYYIAPETHIDKLSDSVCPNKSK